MIDKIAVINRWLEEAMSEGDEAVKAHLHEVARIVGSHVARVSSPNDVPEKFALTVKERGMGVTAGMLMHHGRVGIMDVEMIKLSRSGR